MRDYHQDAVDFVGKLPDRGPPPPPAPRRQDIEAAMSTLYPAFTEGVGARSNALKQKYGEGWGVTSQYIKNHADDLHTPKLHARIIAFRANAEVGEVPVILERDAITIGGARLPPHDTENQRTALDAELMAFFV